MKKNIGSIVVFVVGLLASQITQAQGTVYLSNLDQPSVGSDTVGSDSWLAAGFQTGNNVSGYVLNSIQLGMADASGNPNGFTVMLYFADPHDRALHPGTSLDTLDGSLNPVTAGIYTYTPASNLTLLPDTYYFIVLTAGTAVANGAYEWSLAGANSYNPSDGWSSQGGIWIYNNYTYRWGVTGGIFPQFAINATAVPEPSPSWLLLLGSGIFIYVRRVFRR